MPLRPNFPILIPSLAFVERMKFSRRWLWLLLLVPILIGLGRLRFDVEILNLLPKDSDIVQGLKLYQQNFSNGRELIITVRSLDAEQTEKAAHSIAVALRKETNLVANVNWQPPWLEYPRQSTELIAFLWLNQTPEVFAQLTHRLAPENVASTLAETKELLATSLSPNEIALRSYDPLGLMNLPATVASAMPTGSGQELFSSPDGTFRLIFVEANPDLSGYRDCLAWLDSIKAIVQEIEGSSGQIPLGTIVNYTGRPAFVAEIAGGMERDMFGSVGGTMVIIALLFWMAHRRWRPLIWLLFLLALILGGTMAFGGLIFGTLNVVSMGFAAILLGLAVDYGMVLYQEAQASPHLSAKQIRVEITPSILWSAVTTAGAFAILNLSGLPGLGQLGSLVAIGVVLAGAIMLAAYLPPLLQKKDAPKHPGQPEHHNESLRGKIAAIAWTVTGLILFVAVCVLARRPPNFDHSPDALRPKNSPAYAAVEEIKTALGHAQEPLWILIPGRSESEVARRLEHAGAELTRAISNKLISAVTLPTLLWPQVENQKANRDALEKLLARQQSLQDAATANGFTSNSMALTDSIFATWKIAAAKTNVFWPTNQASRWILDKVRAKTKDGFVAIGLIYPATNSSGGIDFVKTKTFSSELASALRDDEIILSGWTLLGSTMFDLVEKDFPRVLLSMSGLLLVSLWFAFRRVKEVFLSLATLLFSALCLFLLMSMAHWSWNLLNLMALPLLLGAGVDYSIHIQLALRRHDGNIRQVRHSIGRALWLCGGTTIAGFGSLAWSNNAGLSSLGKVCAVGIAATMLTSIYLLPVWWSSTAGRKSRAAEKKLNPVGASVLYRSKLWRLGLALARNLPLQATQTACRAVARIYWLMNRARREIVIQNLLVACKGDSKRAIQVSQELFQQFAIKLADLWRYESGIPIDDLFCELTGWEHFLDAQNQKRGVLILTPHLGNWEFGAPLLSKRGFNLLVITLDEPDDQLTEMRQAARAKWGIETLVIGKDPFAFVEIIRRLDAGATVALLVDRPPANSAIPVKLFGKPFAASVAAAELARASGCVLLPVYLPRTVQGYAAHILPEISYDRAALRGAEARQELTQEIVTTFEQPIREHLDQWYHFVPIWAEANDSKETP